MPRRGRPPGPARARRRWDRDATAVSDVVANVLLVAITIVAASSFGFILAQLPAPAPNARTVIESFVLPTDPDEIVFEHRGGLVVPLRELDVVVEVDGTSTRYNVGGRLAAGDPNWTVVAPDGSLKVADDRFEPGDQARFTDPSLAGRSVRTSAYSTRYNAALLAPAPVAAADAAAPSLVSAVTTSTNTVEGTFSEPLASITAADFVLPGTTINAARLLGNGARAEFTTSGLGSGATPTLSTVAAPTGTRDFAGVLVVGSANVTVADGAPPVVSAVVTTSTSTTLQVNFTTSEAATPTIEYGPTLVYGLATTGPAGTTHSLVLASLTPATTYHFKVAATDAAGNTQTGEPDRAASTLDGGGGGGGGSGSAPNYLDFTTTPSGLDPGIPSSAIVLTLKSASGNAVNPSTAMEVRLATNSTRGHFFDPTTGASIATVTLPTSASSVTIGYVDHRNGGPTVWTASAAATTPGSHVVAVTRRGVVPTAGDSVASLQVNVLYTGEQDRDETGVMLGVNLLNPTPTARTIDRVEVSTSPSPGTGSSAFFRGPLAIGAGSDAAFSGCALSGADSDTVTCDPADFVLPAYGMAQFVLSFRSSNAGSDLGTVVTARAILAGGAGTAASPGVNVRHEGSQGQAAHVRLLAETGAAGNERAGFPSGVAGGAPTDFYFEWFHHESGVRVQTRFTVPAGWSALSVPSQSSLGQFAVSLQQPTATQPGYVIVGHDSPGSDGTREFFFRATPPTGPALEYLLADSAFDTGSRTPAVASHSYAVVIA